MSVVFDALADKLQGQGQRIRLVELILEDLWFRKKTSEGGLVPLLVPSSRSGGKAHSVLAGRGT